MILEKRMTNLENLMHSLINSINKDKGYHNADIDGVKIMHYEDAKFVNALELQQTDLEIAQIENELATTDLEISVLELQEESK